MIKGKERRKGEEGGADIKSQFEQLACDACAPKGTDRARSFLRDCRRRPSDEGKPTRFQEKGSRKKNESWIKNHLSWFVSRNAKGKKKRVYRLQRNSTSLRGHDGKNEQTKKDLQLKKEKRCVV